MVKTTVILTTACPWSETACLLSFSRNTTTAPRLTKLWGYNSDLRTESSRTRPMPFMYGNPPASPPLSSPVDGVRYLRKVSQPNRTYTLWWIHP